jgi:type IV pilus assembly protein PilC
MEATGERELRVRLAREGFHIFAIDARREAGSLLKRRGNVRIPPSEFLLYNQQLSALLRAGIPILQAFQILTRRQKSERLRLVLQDVEERIKTGVPLSEAFAAQGDAFPRIYVASVLAGERSGSLDEVLTRYVTFTKAMLEIRRKLRKALTYPVILICASFVLLAVLTTFVIPSFAKLYGSAGQLPLITQIVVAISDAIRSNMLWLLPLIVGGVVATYFWRKSESGRLTLDRFVLRLPLLGTLVRDMTLAKFARSFSTLLAGGLTVPDSVEIASDSITNRELFARSSAVLRKIREGRPVTESLAEAGWVPELALDMIGVGESSGALQPMLDEVASFFDAELDVRINSLTTIIEPVILVGMGGIVMFILLAIYLPILQAVGNMGQGRIG